MNILLTSAGRRTYMVEYFKSVLHGSGKVYASNSILTNALLTADGYAISPAIYHHDYIAFLLDFCKSNNIDAIISLFDIDLPILAQNKHLFSAIGTTVVVSDFKATQICNDKWLTYKFLNEIGLPQPTCLLSLAEAHQAISNGSLRFPLYIKPRWGMGSIGIYRIDNEDELDVLYRKLHNEIFRTYLKYESAIDSDSCIIIQQAIEGKEYGIEVLNDLQGNYVTTFAKEKIAMRAGETDIAITVDPSPFLNVAQRISARLRHIALLDVDCFVANDGSVFILEMNARFGGQYPFSHIAGANVPLQIINWLNGKDTDMHILTPRVGVRSCKELTTTIF